MEKKNDSISLCKKTTSNNREVVPVNLSRPSLNKIHKIYRERARCWTAFIHSLPIRGESLAQNISCLTDVPETQQAMPSTGKGGVGELTAAEGRCFSCDPPLLVDSRGQIK